MITIKTPDEIAILRQGGQKLAEILELVIKKARPGISTLKLDKYAEKLVLKAGGEPSFKGYNNFTGTICASINEAVVHGVPHKDKLLKEGDIIGLDIGMKYPKSKGFYTDMARTVGLGKISPAAQKLIDITEKSFFKGAEQIKPGAHIGDISSAIQNFVESYGYSVVRSLSGHGVGYKVHEEPNIPNFGEPNTGPILKSGMVLALEPMVCAGHYELETLTDGWTAVTKDKSLTSHYENTVVVTDIGYKILTRK